MYWLDILIPVDPTARAALDMLLHAIHLGLVVFLLTGWAFAVLVRLHFIAVVIVWTSWLGLGWLVGNLGYCVLTDWQWRLKWLSGEHDLPYSYIAYIYRGVTGQEANDFLISAVTALTLIVVTYLSGLRMWRSRRSKED